MTRVSTFLLVVALALPASGQRSPGLRSTGTAPRFTQPETITYLVHAVKSLPEACAQDRDGVVIPGDAEWPHLVIERHVSTGIPSVLLGPFRAIPFTSPAQAGLYVETWRHYRTVRLVTHVDGTTLVVERVE